MRHLLLRSTTLWLTLIGTLFSVPSSAMTIEATGQAVVHNDDIADARYRATEQAIKQAVLQAGTNVIARETMENGDLASSLTMQGAGHAENTEIVNEKLENGILHVTISTEVSPDYLCSNGATNLYRKSVGITGFALQTPQQATLGALHDAPRSLPRTLANEINAQGYLRALAATNVLIYPDLINAPASTNMDGSLTDVARIGEELGVQYVVSGVIRDIGAVYEKHPNNQTLVNKLFDWANEEGNQRNLGIDVYIYDGFNGALLFEQSYQETGEWDVNSREKVGFGSPKFWTTNYGHIVRQVIWQSALDASDKLRCQPFVANIFRTEGNRIHINAGALAGIKKGDVFSVYRRYEIYDQLQNSLTQLNNADINVTIKQVQPNFSIGELAVDARILNVQQQDVVIAW